MYSKEVVIIGYSGHGYVVAEAALDSGLNLSYYADKREGLKNPYNLQYAGFERDDAFWYSYKDSDYILGVGDNTIRVKSANYVKSKGGNILNVIDPKALLSSNIAIGVGNFIAKGVCINSLAEIEDYCIINTASVIEHECKIGAGSHIAPGTVLAGNVKVGKNTFVGANTVIRQGITIGDNVVIGAGSVVVKNIPDNEVWLGNPAKKVIL